MSPISIDPASFRAFVELYADNDAVKNRVETMTDAQIIDLVENNLNYEDLMAVINEAENAALSQLETE